jgi:hypothetical protein
VGFLSITDRLWNCAATLTVTLYFGHNPRRLIFPIATNSRQIHSRDHSRDCRRYRSGFDVNSVFGTTKFNPHHRCILRLTTTGRIGTAPAQGGLVSRLGFPRAGALPIQPYVLSTGTTARGRNAVQLVNCFAVVVPGRQTRWPLRPTSRSTVSRLCGS